MTIRMEDKKNVRMEMMVNYDVLSNKLLNEFFFKNFITINNIYESPFKILIGNFKIYFEKQ
jgi:hypothetical protein